MSYYRKTIAKKKRVKEEQPTTKICKECGQSFTPFDTYYNLLCKECKESILNVLKSPISPESPVQHVDNGHEYKILDCPETKWLNNRRFSTDYWMFKGRMEYC